MRSQDGRGSNVGRESDRAVSACWAQVETPRPDQNAIAVRRRSAAARAAGWWLSSSSWRVRWALAIKGVPYRSEMIDLRAGEQHRPEHRARNPLGYVPTLRIDVKGMKYSVIGYGNVGSWTARILTKHGAKLVAVMDHTGGIRNDGGIDTEALAAHVAKAGGVANFKAGATGSGNKTAQGATPISTRRTTSRVVASCTIRITSSDMLSHVLTCPVPRQCGQSW